VLEVRDLHKRYGDQVALDGIDLRVERGQLVGFLGPNGAGKTTTMRAILQLVSLDAGSVTWDGAPITEPVRQQFGYMPAERGMYPTMRVREQVVYFARLSGLGKASARAAADRWLERLGLADRHDTEIQDLSSGNQQRVQLAVALVNDPPLLVLDEPFSGLDPVAVESLKEILLDRVRAGAALLFSSHQLDLVEDVSRDVVIIDRGRVVLEGDVGRIRSSSTRRYVSVAYEDGTRTRVQVPAGPDVDPARLLAEAAARGPVVEFDFAPPDLSEVFLEAIRADGPGGDV
jgi:ABC-2 type transport system ATP-binding protein